MVKVVMAGGGTASHVILCWRRRHGCVRAVEVVDLLGTATGLESDLVPAAGFRWWRFLSRAVAASPFPRVLRRAMCGEAVCAGGGALTPS